MYKNNSKRQCLICYDNLYTQTSLYHLCSSPSICMRCLQSFIIIEKTTNFYNYSLTVLYQYNEFFQQLLYQYKGTYDYALKDIFLESWKQELSKQYNHYQIVIVPSSKEDNEKRGFCPNTEIVHSFSKNIFTGIYKTSDYKQTKQKDRSQIRNVLSIHNGNQLTNKDIVIFDDVITSGSSILAAIDLIVPFHPKSITILVLATRQIEQLFE